MRPAADAGLGSTYRIQLNGTGFERARQLVGYLDALGVQTLYVSPVLAAVPGSTHGYDVADATRIDPELGGDDGLEALLAELDAHGMRLLVDVVPNHMAASPANPWWWDVLRRGRGSRYAGYFDIDWTTHHGKVVLPVLGSPLGEVLAAGQLAVDREGSQPMLVYGDLRFPLRRGSAPGRAGPDRADLVGLLEAQHYRLAYWRLGNREGNYRRFFDVDGLVGVRVEEPAVLRATHQRLFKLGHDRRVAGFRVDHVDGLADPGAYLRSLGCELHRRRSEPAVVLIEKILARGEELPGAWPVDGTTGYEFADLAGGLFVEGRGAAALARAPRPRGAAQRRTDPFETLAVQAKANVLGTLFRGQAERLARQTWEAVEATTYGADLAEVDVRHALVALTAQLPVYRTYLDQGPPSATDRRLISEAAGRAALLLDAEGRRALDRLVQGLLGGDAGPVPAWLAVARRWQQLTSAVAAKGVEDTALYRFDGLLASAEVGGHPGAPAVDPAEFHQAMAGRAAHHPGSLSSLSTHDTKRGEDVRARLAVLSEMSDRWSAQVARWRSRHQALVAGLGGAPSPHDEVLVYQSVVGTWPPGPGGRRGYASRIQDYVVKAAREAKRETSWLDPDDRYERALRRFIAKLLGRDGGRFTAEVTGLVRAIGPAAATNSLALVVVRATAPGVPDLYQGTELWAPTLVDPDNRRPVDFVRRMAVVADLDAWADKPRAELAARLLSSWTDGRIKLYVTREVLRLRRDRPALFGRSRYQSLDVRGAASGHAVAYARLTRADAAVVVVPRLALGLAGPGRFPRGVGRWRDTSVTVPRGARPSRWRDVLTGSVVSAEDGRLSLGRVLRVLPVAVLVPE